MALTSSHECGSTMSNKRPLLPNNFVAPILAVDPEGIFLSRSCRTCPKFEMFVTDSKQIVCNECKRGCVYKSQLKLTVSYKGYIYTLLAYDKDVEKFLGCKIGVFESMMHTARERGKQGNAIDTMIMSVIKSSIESSICRFQLRDSYVNNRRENGLVKDPVIYNFTHHPHFQAVRYHPSVSWFWDRSDKESDKGSKRPLRSEDESEDEHSNVKQPRLDDEAILSQDESILERDTMLE
ncbi:hypothetical protein BJ742DRAFT_842889 [Cladochytrium replicatum]|nr:hypothetical protein BJ742DRAFT_842889 [Cladochytrium replicatum]